MLLTTKHKVDRNGNSYTLVYAGAKRPTKYANDPRYDAQTNQLRAAEQVATSYGYSASQRTLFLALPDGNNHDCVFLFESEVGK